MRALDEEIRDLMEKMSDLSLSEYIKSVIRIHHHFTVIHPFNDGNGRTARALANMMLLKRNISPVFFKEADKNKYKEGLKMADSNSYELLYETFFKSILDSFATLSDFSI